MVSDVTRIMPHMDEFYIGHNVFSKAFGECWKTNCRLLLSQVAGGIIFVSSVMSTVPSSWNFKYYSAPPPLGSNLGLIRKFMAPVFQLSPKSRQIEKWNV